MQKFLYVMILEKTKLYNRMTKADVLKHVDNLKALDNDGKLELCGPIKGYPGVGGMIILKTHSYEEAENICKAEPFVVSGFTTYKLVTLEVANKENNFLI